jgi:NADH:ubiquinone oxidoreductase subunit E
MEGYMCNCERLGTDEQVAKFEGVLQENKNCPDNVMVALQKTQGIFGYIPEKTVAMISKSLNVAENYLFVYSKNG